MWEDNKQLVKTIVASLFLISTVTFGYSSGPKHEDHNTIWVHGNIYESHQVSLTTGLPLLSRVGDQHVK